MSQIVLAGDSSGTIALTVPVAAGTNILTLPAETGTLISTATTTVTFTGSLTSGNLSTGGNLTVTGRATVSNSLAVGNTTPSGTVGEIRATNAITAFYSDERLKTDVTPIENALDKIEQLTGVLYTQNKLAEQFGYKDYSQQVGLLAHQVKAVQPEAVKLAPFDADVNGNSISGENYLTVQYEKLVPLLIEGIKELRAEIKKLKGE